MDTGVFGASYLDCRRKFLESGSGVSARLESFEHPLFGPSGEPLACDVQIIGDPGAARILVLESGLHGAEGFAGSAIQVAVLRTLIPPSGIALVLVHAINPWGFAWNRRVNEDNVDLNRHFLDWDAPGDLTNEGYAALADVLIPDDDSETAIARSNAALEAYRVAHGDAALSAAIKRGQYCYPDGLHYGGTGKSWSSETVVAITERFLKGATKLGVIDVHTGLGPYGFGECLSGEAPDSGEGSRASAWYGDVAHTKSPASGYSGSSASILDGYRRAAHWAEITPIGLEFGTQATVQVRNAVQLDAWLHLNGGRNNSAWDRVKARMSDAFNPDDPKWQNAVVSRGLTVVSQGLAALAA